MAAAPARPYCALGGDVLEADEAHAGTADVLPDACHAGTEQLIVL